MKTEIRRMLDNAHGTKLQNSYGLQTKPRAKKLSVQIQTALDDAVKAKNADPSTQDLIKARLRALERLDDRKLRKKLKTLTDANMRLKAEIAELKAAALARPTRPMTEVERVLAELKAGGQQ